MRRSSVFRRSAQASLLPVSRSALAVLALASIAACGEPATTPGGGASSGGHAAGASGAVSGVGAGGLIGSSGLGSGGDAVGGLSGSGGAGVGGAAGASSGGGTLPGSGMDPQVPVPSCSSDLPSNVANVIEHDHGCWFTFDMPWDDDSSNVTSLRHLLDAPAGKHGYLTVDGDGHFAFEDQPGKRVRFNGVTLTAGANYPDKALAPGIAARLARFGVNLVRVTFQDFIPPFGFFKSPLSTTRELDPVQLDKLDWFIHQLKLQGIYVHLDFLSARPFLEGDGVANQLPTLGQKIGTLFDPTLIALQQELIGNLLTHENPYTGLAYKDDPAVPLSILTNENALFLGWVAWLPDKVIYRPDCSDCLSQYYSTELDQLYNTWLKGKYAGDAALKTAWGSLPDGESLATASVRRTPMSRFDQTSKARIRDEARFYYETEGKYLRQLRSYIRETLGSRMLVTMTTQEFGVASVASQAQGDFLDNNIYWHHPSSLERAPGKYFGFYDAPIVSHPQDSQNIAVRINQARAKGLPTIVSEFNYNFPNSYQMEAPAMAYAFLNYMGGDGLLWHAYYNFSARTDATDLVDMFEIGASPHIMSQFLLAKPYLAGDLKEPASFADVALSEQDLWDTVWRNRADKVITPDGPPLSSLLATPMARSYFADSTQTPSTMVDPGNDFVTGNGELHWDGNQGLLTVDNAHWQGAVGYFKGDVALSRVELRGVTTTGGRDFASINLVAMDDQPVESSNRLVLTSVARAENTGQTWNPPEERAGRTPLSSLHDLGTGPVLLEPIHGEVGLSITEPEAVEVWALDARGNGLYRVATRSEGGKVWFDLGHPTLWYQIGRRR